MQRPKIIIITIKREREREVWGIAGCLGKRYALSVCPMCRERERDRDRNDGKCRSMRDTKDQLKSKVSLGRSCCCCWWWVAVGEKETLGKSALARTACVCCCCCCQGGCTFDTAGTSCATQCHIHLLMEGRRRRRRLGWVVAC